MQLDEPAVAFRLAAQIADRTICYAFHHEECLDLTLESVTHRLLHT